MTDIVELIRDDHRRLRRLQETLRDATYLEGPKRGLASTWDRLAGLAEAHILAGQEVCWPAMAGGGPHHRDILLDGLAADAADIRDAIATSRLHPAGSRCWWLAARDALRGLATLLDREEHDLLASFPRRASPFLRSQLGRQRQAFMATSSGHPTQPRTP